MPLFRPNVAMLKEAADIPGLTAALHHRNAHVRADAAAALTALARGGNGDAAEVVVAEVVAGGLPDGEPGRFARPEDVVGLLLSDVSYESFVRSLRVVTRHAEALGPAATRPLGSVLRDVGAHHMVREQACEALGAIGGPDATDVLVRTASEDGDPFVRGAAAVALLRTGDRRAGATAVDVLADQLHIVTSGSKVQSGIFVFSDIEVADMLKALGRDSAVAALDRTNRERLVAVVCASFPNVHGSLRAHAAELLGRLREPAAVDVLVAALDNDDYAAVEAARALGAIGDARAVAALANIVLVASDRLGERARRAEEAERDWEYPTDGSVAAPAPSFSDVRRAAYEALLQIGGPEAERAASDYRA